MGQCVLFDIVMDEVIQKVRQGQGYRMGNRENQKLCYADNAALITKNTIS